MVFHWAGPLLLTIPSWAHHEDTVAHANDLEDAAADEGNLEDRRESNGPDVQAPASGRKQAEGARDLGSLT